MTNFYGSNRDVLTLDDELNQSFYETENDNEEFNFTEQSSNRRQKSQLVTYFPLFLKTVP
jgi:hypothetical protein